VKGLGLNFRQRRNGAEHKILGFVVDDGNISSASALSQEKGQTAISYLINAFTTGKLVLAWQRFSTFPEF
jgi:hypothetical protein